MQQFVASPVISTRVLVHVFRDGRGERAQENRRWEGRGGEGMTRTR